MASPNPPPKAAASAAAKPEAASSSEDEAKQMADMVLEDAQKKAAEIVAEAERRAAELAEEAEKRAEQAYLAQRSRSPESRRSSEPLVVEPVMDGYVTIRPLRDERATIAMMPYNFERGKAIQVPREILDHLFRCGIVAQGPG